MFSDVCKKCYDPCIFCGQIKPSEDQACSYCLNNVCEKCKHPFSCLETKCLNCFPSKKMQSGKKKSAKTFSGMLRNVFELAAIREEFIDGILEREKDIELAFTPTSFDSKHNNEMLEFIGDGMANAALVKYFLNRYPQLNCPKGVKIMARLKINYVSGSSFAEIAENLGFLPFIKTGHQEQEQDTYKLLEDTFEAFIGVVAEILDNKFQVGVGFHVVYHLLKTIFDDREISLEYEDLYDAKSRLKELFDANPTLGKIDYDDNIPGLSKAIWIHPDKTKELLGEGRDAKTKNQRQKLAAEMALAKLEKLGFKRAVDFSLTCE